MNKTYLKTINQMTDEERETELKSLNWIINRNQEHLKNCNWNWDCIERCHLLEKEIKLKIKEILSKK